jgi:hypothetical protein
MATVGIPLNETHRLLKPRMEHSEIDHLSV